MAMKTEQMWDVVKKFAIVMLCCFDGVAQACENHQVVGICGECLPVALGEKLAYFHFAQFGPLPVCKKDAKIITVGSILGTVVAHNSV